MDEDDPLYQIGKTVWELEIQLRDILKDLLPNSTIGNNTIVLVKASIVDCDWLKIKVKELAKD